MNSIPLQIDQIGHTTEFLHPTGLSALSRHRRRRRSGSITKTETEPGTRLSTACDDDRRSRSAGVSAIEVLPRSSS
jgi:hypothetical protein